MIRTVLNPHTYSNEEKFLKEKVTTVNIIMILMGCVISVFTVLRYLQSNYLQAFVDLVLFLVIASSYLLLFKNKYRIRNISRFLIFFAVLTSLTLIVFTPEVETRFVWVNICIYMMFFLLDLKEGVRWFLVTMALLIGLYVMQAISIRVSDFTIFFVATSLFALLLSRYEKIKEESEEYFVLHNRELQDAVTKKTEELNAQKEMFESLFQKSYDGLLLIENGMFIECNDAIVSMLGYEKKEDLLHAHPSELSPMYQPDGRLSREKADEMMQVCLEKGAHHFSWIHQKAGGEDFWCDVTLTHLILHERELIHVVWRDISEQKALEIENRKINENLEHEVKKRTQELEVALRAKADFLANMSHEIRTPLNALLGFVTILKKDETDEDRKKYFDIVHTSGQSLLTIINDILDFSKIESGKLELEMVPFSLIKPFEEVQLLFFEKAKEKDIALDMNANPPLPLTVLGDTVRIKQVASNLVSNAIKFTPKHGLVSINLTYDHEHSMLSCCVADSGIGISSANLETIFDSFSQADSSITRSFGGTGLGLAISQRLVRLMHGRIDVESTVGAGSRFTFTIRLEPLEVEEVEEGASAQEDEAREETLRLQGNVLIVEDNKMNQMLVQVILEELGVESDVVDNGLEAVEMLRKGSYDLILMDENMPVMNGIEATRQIRAMEVEKHIPVIAVTANAIEGDRERFMEAGMDDYISKPIEHGEFTNALKRYLQRQ